MESYIKPNIENSYIYFNKTNGNQKSFILQIQLNTKDETTELFYYHYKNQLVQKLKIIIQE